MDDGLPALLPLKLPLQAELEALKEGLSIALTYGYTPLMIETNATEVISVLHFGCVPRNSIIYTCICG